MYTSSYQRERNDRNYSRSRDDKRFTTRSPSNQDPQRSRPRQGRTRKKVKFDEAEDVRVFRKQDQPCAKGLSEQQIAIMKNQLQKEIEKSYDFNWQHYRHRDAQLESNKIKEQREQQKQLSQRLLGVRQQMSFGNVRGVRVGRGQMAPVEVGVDSVEREGHSTRIFDILGCYYTHVSQIPHQPPFQLLNTNTAHESKNIPFENNQLQLNNDTLATRKSQSGKALKGILKAPAQVRAPQPRQVSPQLIWLLKDFKLNPSLYSKEKTQQLLKPFRESGQLEYLMNNKDILQTMWKSTAAPSAAYTSTSTNRTAGSMPKQDSMDRNNPPNNNPQYNHAFVPKADKFRTVPCKYYHSAQGCTKIDNCTFIHDQRYAGVAIPAGVVPFQGPLPSSGSQPRNTPTYNNNNNNYTGSSMPYNPGNTANTANTGQPSINMPPNNYYARPMVAYGALNAGYAGYPPRSEPSPNSSRNPGNYGNNNYNRYGAGWDGNYGAARTSVPPPSNGGPSYPSASSGQAYPPASSGQGYPPASSASGYPPASSSSYPGPSSGSGYPPNYYGGNQGK